MRLDQALNQYTVRPYVGLDKATTLRQALACLLFLPQAILRGFKTPYQSFSRTEKMQVAQGFSLIGVLCFACSACSQSSSETDGNLNVIEQLMVNHLHNRNGTSTEIGIVYTPSTPAPENINCFVEVPTTTRVGGRCIQLGSIRGRSSRNSPWACQAGVHLAITQECQRSRPRPRSGRRRGGSG